MMQTIPGGIIQRDRRFANRAGGGRALTGLLALWLAMVAPASAEDELPAATQPAGEKSEPVRPADDFSAFRLVLERNIFNPNRSRRSSRPDNGAETVRPPRIDLISLAGTMSYERGTFAFFDSTSSEFKQALQTGGVIAGYTLKQVTPDLVQLERAGATLELKVGQQLRRVEEGAWELTSGQSIQSATDGPGRERSRPDRDSTTSTSDSTSPAAASSEGPSEALKRLLEQRRKENNP